MTIIINQEKSAWFQRQSLTSLSYICGFCNNQIASVSGYKVGLQADGSGHQVAAIYICPHCGGPTFVDSQKNYLPDVAFGSSVNHVPEDLSKLYDEARKCTSNSAYTAKWSS